MAGNDSGRAGQEDASKRYWGLTAGRWTAIGGLGAILAVIVPIASPYIQPSREPEPSPDTSTSTSSSSSAPPFPKPTPKPQKSRDVSKSVYLAEVEKVCLDDTPGIPFPPDKDTDPQGFGRWLKDIISINGEGLEKMDAVKKPTADKGQLEELFAQRRHANSLFDRSAKAFEDFEQATGEQFLDSAISVESKYRKKAREYGFKICIGSDTPGH